MLYDHLLIVDVEATCWANKPPPGETSEIIEIGVCLYDLQTGAIGDADGMLVKPARSNVSPFCTRLTTITADMLTDAPPFADVCEQLRSRYHSAARAWASWGAYDRKMFESQCASFGVPYPFSDQHTICSMFQVQYLNDLRYLINLVVGRLKF